MTLKGGRLEFLVPHMLRSQLLRPGFVSMSLKLGFAQQMPPWAKLQFTNAGVSSEDLEHVLGRITGLTSWVDEWESLGRAHEQAARDALALGRPADAARRFLAASAAYNFSQYVIFMDKNRKRTLHDSCTRAYALAAPLFDPPAVPFEVIYRRRAMKGYLRVPPGGGPVPVVVMFNGTNAVKEELHWWSDALLERGIATIYFDGPGLGETFHRLSMVAEPRPVGVAILNQIETRPELDPEAVAFFGMSLGGYLAIRMASHDPRVRAVAAVSPPYSADIYWNVTLVSMRRELAALYDTSEREMGAAIDRITLAHVLPALRCPLIISGGGHDLITPGSEAYHIFEDARCERELVFYPRGAHDCFNVIADLRPRMVGWLARQLERHHAAARVSRRVTVEPGSGWGAAEAVDDDFADELSGDVERIQWHQTDARGIPARWRWWWHSPDHERIEVVRRLAPGESRAVVAASVAPA
jgi:alpha-beta hydrolase superfamily lysophospholipase